MDRVVFYPSQQPTDTDFLSLQRNVMVALGHVAQSIYGTNTTVDGLVCSAQSPASMSVNISGGLITSLASIDSTPYGSLAADNNLIVKVGTIDAVTAFGPLVAPTTSGNEVQYLIQASFDETDTNPIVLSYFDSANPSVPYSGPGGAGTSQNTLRQQTVALQLKRGTEAGAGLSVAPSVDPGYVGLWLVKVAQGQTSVTGANISQYPGAPFVQSRLGTAYAPIASPAFTGHPTAPTPAPGDNSGALATTAFVAAAVGGDASVAATPSTLALRDASGGLTATNFHGNADTATTANYANSAGSATNATNSANATFANSAAYATSAGTATSATNATNANSATYATSAGTAANSNLLSNMAADTTAQPSTVAARLADGSIAATVFAGTATKADYGDVAERFEASEPLEAGDVVDIGGDREICRAVADFCGVISTAPALRMNESAGDDTTHPFVGYLGRIPVKVNGPVSKGGYLELSGIPGVAQAGGDKTHSIGRALEDKTSEGVGLVLALIVSK